MIDTLTETVVSLTEAAKLLPCRRGGKRIHLSCLYRWTVSGCKGVVLESVQIGGTRCTSREALSRFFTRLTAVVNLGSGVPPAMTSTVGRQRQIESAEAVLEKAGI